MLLPDHAASTVTNRPEYLSPPRPQGRPSTWSPRDGTPSAVAHGFPPGGSPIWDPTTPNPATATIVGGDGCFDGVKIVLVVVVVMRGVVRGCCVLVVEVAL